jgi:hypothetical protein
MARHARGRAGADARRLIAVLVAALALGCPKKETPQPKGRRIAEGAVAAVRASPDGAFVAWLASCAAAPLGPRGARTCELRVAPVAGGEARAVATGVPNQPDGFAWIDDGALLALGAYDHRTGAGRLVRWERGGAVRPLADGVTFYATAAGARLGWISNGVLYVVGGPQGPVSVANRVATFEFAPPRSGAVGLLARRQSAAGGELLAIASGGAVRPVAARAGDYRFSPRGDYAFTAQDGEVEALAWAPAGNRPVPVRRNVHGFAFAPAGDAIAYIADLAPGRQGDLWVARLPVSGAAAPGEKLGERVGEFRWAAEAPRLAWLEGFDPATRSGALVVGGPGEKPARLGERVSAYELAPDGARAAFLEHVVAGGYSVDLKLAHLGGAPRVEEIARGVFGFELAPERDALWYRTGCVRNGESCDLFRVPAAGVAPGQKPELVAQGVKSFEFDRRVPRRVLLGWAREDRDALDLGVWEGGRIERIDRGALPGSAAFLGPDSARLVYAVVEAGREGVYVAEVGR